jgi:hypothetical protein
VGHPLLGVQAAAGLLLPVTVWLSVGLWRRMNDAERLWMRAGADLTVALLLGASLVLTLVWLANLLDMPAAEVSALRDAAGRAAVLIDVPWWAWFGLYLALAAATLAFALRPAWLQRVRLGRAGWRS